MRDSEKQIPVVSSGSGEAALRPGDAAPARAIRVALAGNPNSGKTTLFNALTGARQRVGNYPGVTVERKEGTRRHGDATLAVLDLPGVYTLSAWSPEERVALDAILRERPDVVVDVLDATNLERNLYLAVQLSELGIPLVLALNMIDEADRHGVAIDDAALSRAFGARVVRTCASGGQGIEALLDEVVAAAREGAIDPASVASGAMATHAPDAPDAPVDPSVAVERATRRYDFIAQVVRDAVRVPERRPRTATERIDALALHRAAGLPLFFALMYLVFHLVFTLAEPLTGTIESANAALASAVAAHWPGDPEGPLASLVVDGILGGVGGVLVFLPNILLLFLAIALLEDTGYMARAAFLMDRIMRGAGLSGRSFIPMLVGFGCSVPAILATRTIEDRRDRLATMLVLPLVSCGARLPIYALLIPAFFPARLHAPMLFAVYLLGLALAAAAALVLRGTLLSGGSASFMMELPPYRMPSARTVLMLMLERAGMYLKKAGTLILALSVLLWAMMTWPALPAERAAAFAAERASVVALEPDGTVREERLAEIAAREGEAKLTASLAGRIGRAIEPLIAPLGFDWRIGVSLIGAVAAKEVFVAQVGVVFSLGEVDEESSTLRARLRAAYPPLVGFCIMLFCLISSPCLATVAVTARESGAWRYAALQFFGLTALAWIVTAAVHQAGVRLGIGLV